MIGIVNIVPIDMVMPSFSSGYYYKAVFQAHFMEAIVSWSIPTIIYTTNQESVIPHTCTWHIHAHVHAHIEYQPK